MPVNDPHHRPLLREGLAPSAKPDRRTVVPSQMHTDQGSENFHTWMESTHGRLTPGASQSYSYSGGDQQDYYSGRGPEVAAAAASLKFDRGRVQSPKTSDGRQAHWY